MGLVELTEIDELQLEVLERAVRVVGHGVQR
jgi:hypothetical protein